MIGSNIEFPSWEKIKSINSETDMNLYQSIDMNTNNTNTLDDGHYLGQVMNCTEFFNFCSE